MWNNGSSVDKRRSSFANWGVNPVHFVLVSFPFADELCSKTIYYNTNHVHACASTYFTSWETNVFQVDTKHTIPVVWRKLKWRKRKEGNRENDINYYPDILLSRETELLTSLCLLERDTKNNLCVVCLLLFDLVNYFGLSLDSPA